MLSSESIHQQMKNVSSCSTQQLSALKELMELYPYASSFVTLYLKSLANDRDLRLNSQLEKYAYQIPNRELLYELLVTQSSLPQVPIQAVERIKPILEIVPEETKVEVQTQVQEEVNDSVAEPVELLDDTEELIDQRIEEPIIVDSPAIFNNETISASKNNKDEFPEEGEEETPLNIPHQLMDQRENDEVDTLIQSAVISSSYLQMAYPDVTENSEEVFDQVDSSADESPFENMVNAQPELSSEEPKSFTDWLRMGEILDGSVDDPSPEEKKPSFYHFEKPKKEFFSPAKKAKESVDENKMPVSETLAQVFALQGNINKAIQVYEQLSLIFPEKKSFFASQIRNLKRKLNS